MSHTPTLNDQAFELFDRGDLHGARSLYEQACSLDTNDSEARMMLGVIKAEVGDLAGAESLLRQSLALESNFADTHYYLGNILHARNQLAEAVTCLERAVELDPDFTDASTLLNTLYTNLANVLLQQEKFEQAASCFEKQIRLQPEQSVAWFMLGRTRGQQGQYTEAERCCREALSLDPDLLGAHLILTSFLMMQGRTKEACIHCDRALQLEPDNINTIALSANIAKHMGDPEKSYSLLAPLLESGVQHVNIALAFAMISKDVDRQQQSITLMENILSITTSLGTASQSNLHFNLGKLYDDIKQYDKAFSHYHKGNTLKSLTFDCDAHVRSIEKHIEIQSSDFLARLPRARLPSDRPIFIVGMVRSGTSLVEQILSSHPDVYGAGELADIYQISNELPGILGVNVPYPECLSQLSQAQVESLSQRYLDRLMKISPDAKRVVDKLPGNFMHLGLIQSLFPDARVIHCTRDPIDTCLSTYFQDFSSSHPYAYDFVNLGIFYKSYLKVMDHWRKVLDLSLFEISYEDLVADQEQVSRSLLEFCGLEWDDRCLQFHKTKRFIRTASYDQVNQPLYEQSVARWKHYEQYLEPLLTALKD